MHYQLLKFSLNNEFYDFETENHAAAIECDIEF